jgi:hypothetical protein
MGKILENQVKEVLQYLFGWKFLDVVNLWRSHKSQPWCNKWLFGLFACF